MLPADGRGITDTNLNTLYMENKRTCLYGRHVALGALMQPFAGYDMPIQYSSIIDEHNAVRMHCGVFDVSHMGEAVVTGKDAERYVNHVFTNDVSRIEAGQVMYGMMLYPDGGTVDDLLAYKMSPEKYLLVINAANTAKDLDWLRGNAGGFSVGIEDASDRLSQLAVQGPEAEAVMEQVLGIGCKELAFYTFKSVTDGGGRELIVSRTGYTGEDGFEIYAGEEAIVDCWDRLAESGRCRPCGLGCRDTLRFEVGLPLYGNELSREISPMMAGLGMFCKTEKDGFIGKEAIARQKADGVSRRIVGIEIDGHAVPRHGYAVMHGGERVGTVTTGYRSISTGRSVCMALVDAACSNTGTPLTVQIRKKEFAGTVVKKRFYDKHYKK